MSQVTIAMKEKGGEVAVLPGETAREREQSIQIENLLLSVKRLEDCVHAVAHDFREPLRTIRAFTSLMVRHTQLDEKGTQIAQFIQEGGKRMEALFETLYSSAVMGVGQPSMPVDLKHAVAGALADLDYAIASSGAIVNVGPLPFVTGNETQVVRVLGNLIGNAIKYRGAAPPRIFITAECRLNQVTVRIRDNGKGIALADHKRIFRMSERVGGSDVPGSGMGLAICERTVESMGGAIWVESEPGGGSTFCFTIRAAGMEDEVLEKHPPQGQALTEPPLRDQTSSGAAVL